MDGLDAERTAPRPQASNQGFSTPSPFMHSRSQVCLELVYFCREGGLREKEDGARATCLPPLIPTTSSIQRRHPARDPTNIARSRRTKTRLSSRVTRQGKTQGRAAEGPARQLPLAGRQYPPTS